MLSLNCHARCRASRYFLTAQCAFREAVMAVVEKRCHKQFGHFKYHYASVCTNVTLIISVVFCISIFFHSVFLTLN